MSQEFPYQMAERVNAMLADFEGRTVAMMASMGEGEGDEARAWWRGAVEICGGKVERLALVAMRAALDGLEADLVAAEARGELLAIPH